MRIDPTEVAATTGDEDIQIVLVKIGPELVYVDGIDVEGTAVIITPGHALSNDEIALIKKKYLEAELP